MKDKLLKIINNYGVNNQLRKFNEETFELQEAIVSEKLKDNIQNTRPLYDIVESRKHIAEEIADCYVMLEQFRLHYNISSNIIKTMMEYKINRQIDRIKKEDND